MKDGLVRKIFPRDVNVFLLHFLGYPLFSQEFACNPNGD